MFPIPSQFLSSSQQTWVTHAENHENFKKKPRRQKAKALGIVWNNSVAEFEENSVTPPREN